MLAQIADGHVDLADVLFLIAAIVFAIAAILPAFTHVRNPDGTSDTRVNFGLSLVPLGLCLLSVAWFVI